MTTPGHAHVAQVAEQARAWHAARAAAAHAATITTGWYRPDSHLRRVTANCACGAWQAEGIVNTLAPAYDAHELPTRLRVLHRDHVTDGLLAAHQAATAALAES